MLSLLLVFFTLILSFLLHSRLHKRLQARGHSSLRVTFVYFGGFAILSFALFFTQSPYIFSSLVLYIGCALFLSYLYLTVHLAGETPSSMILHALSQNKRMRTEELYRLFSQEKLIWKRVLDLEARKFITTKADRIRTTIKGERLSNLLRLYRSIFHRPLGG